jgi:hypothetical protein
MWTDKRLCIGPRLDAGTEMESSHELPVQKSRVGWRRPEIAGVLQEHLEACLPGAPDQVRSAKIIQPCMADGRAHHADQG